MRPLGAKPWRACARPFWPAGPRRACAHRSTLAGSFSSAGRWMRRSPNRRRRWWAAVGMRAGCTPPDKAFGGRGVGAGRGGQLAAGLAEWLTAARFLPTVVADRTRRALEARRRAWLGWAAARSSGRATEAAACLAAFGCATLGWALAAWGVRDHSYARILTRFERAAAVRRQGDLVAGAVGGGSAVGSGSASAGNGPRGRPLASRLPRTATGSTCCMGSVIKGAAMGRRPLLRGWGWRHRLK